jgi:hypothetical protein
VSDYPNRRRGESGLFQSEDGYEPIPFDLDVLAKMPDEGATKGRYMPDYLTVPQIKRLLDPTLTSGFVSVRLRAMKDEGLVKRTGGHGSSGGWQRTAKGRALVEQDG